MRNFKLLFLLFTVLVTTGFAVTKPAVRSPISSIPSIEAAAGGGGGGGATFNGWEQVGNTYTMPLADGSGGELIVYSSTRVLDVNISADDLIMLGWDGTNLTQLDTLNISATSDVKGCVTPNYIMIVDATNETLKAYTWDEGTDTLALDGTQALTAGNNTVVACDTDEDEVVVWDNTNDDMWLYDYNGTSWTLHDTNTVDFLGGAGFIANVGNDTFIFANASEDLQPFTTSGDTIATTGTTLITGWGACASPYINDYGASSFIFTCNATTNGRTGRNVFLEMSYSGGTITPEEDRIIRFYDWSGGVAAQLDHSVFQVEGDGNGLLFVKSADVDKIAVFQEATISHKGVLDEASAEMYVDVNHPSSYDAVDTETITDLEGSYDFNFGAAQTTDGDEPPMQQNGGATVTAGSGLIYATINTGTFFEAQNPSGAAVMSMHTSDTNDAWVAYLFACTRGSSPSLGGTGGNNSYPGWVLWEGGADDLSFQQLQSTTPPNVSNFINNICPTSGTTPHFLFVSVDTDGTTNNFYYKLDAASGVPNSITFEAGSNAASRLLWGCAPSGATTEISCDNMDLLAFASGDGFINTDATIDAIRQEMSINSRIIPVQDF